MTTKKNRHPISLSLIVYNNFRGKEKLIENTCILILKQESPPAWTQEAYRPPRRKCSLCRWRGVPHLGIVGGTHPVMVGGTPSSHGGGYSIQSWWGYSIQSWWGYLPPSTIQTWLKGYPTIQTWPGYPPHHPYLAGGYPGYPPPSRPGRDTLHPPTIFRMRAVTIYLFNEMFW